MTYPLWVIFTIVIHICFLSERYHTKRVKMMVCFTWDTHKKHFFIFHECKGKTYPLVSKLKHDATKNYTWVLGALTGCVLTAVHQSIVPSR